MEAFQQELARALAHLYDLAFLETSPLASLVGSGSPPQRSRGKTLRKAIRDAIQDLRPSDGTPSDSPAWRPYRILEGRYLAELSHIELEKELFLGQSQYYREHSKAVAALSSVLWHEWGMEAHPGLRRAPSVPDSTALALAELAELERQEPPRNLDARDVLQDLVAFLRSALRARNVSLELSLGTEPLSIHSSPGMLKQCLLLPLSKVAGSLSQGTVQIQARLDRDEVLLDIAPRGTAAYSVQADDRDMIQSFIEAAGGAVFFDDTEGSLAVRIRFPARLGKRTALLVDNSRELANLFSRYLEGGPWSLVHAETVPQALEICGRQLPSLILLDVLMPGQDGWQLLTYLKSRPRASDIPVVICSVLNQPQLAIALGAIGYLRKPITQESLLEALERWGQPLRSQEKAPAERP